VRLDRDDSTSPVEVGRLTRTVLKPAAKRDANVTASDALPQYLAANNNALWRLRGAVPEGPAAPSILASNLEVSDLKKS
jgi:hypothetical protein